MKTEEELKQIAIDLVEGKIFSILNLRSPNDVTMVFLPIALGAFNECTKEQIEDIGLIYEYLDKAGPRAINGYPSFMSFQYLPRDLSMRVLELSEKYKKLKATF